MDNLQKCDFYPVDQELSSLFKPAATEVVKTYLISHFNCLKLN